MKYIKKFRLTSISTVIRMLLIVTIIWVASLKLDKGSLADWFGAVGTIGSVALALWQNYENRLLIIHDRKEAKEKEQVAEQVAKEKEQIALIEQVMDTIQMTSELVDGELNHRMNLLNDYQLETYIPKKKILKEQLKQSQYNLSHKTGLSLIGRLLPPELYPILKPEDMKKYRANYNNVNSGFKEGVKFLDAKSSSEILKIGSEIYMSLLGMTMILMTYRYDVVKGVEDKDA